MDSSESDDQPQREPVHRLSFEEAMTAAENHCRVARDGNDGSHQPSPDSPDPVRAAEACEILEKLDRLRRTIESNPRLASLLKEALLLGMRCGVFGFEDRIENGQIQRDRQDDTLLPAALKARREAAAEAEAVLTDDLEQHAVEAPDEAAAAWLQRTFPERYGSTKRRSVQKRIYRLRRKTES